MPHRCLLPLSKQHVTGRGIRMSGFLKSTTCSPRLRVGWLRSKIRTERQLFRFRPSSRHGNRRSPSANVQGSVGCVRIGESSLPGSRTTCCRIFLPKSATGARDSLNSTGHPAQFLCRRTLAHYPIRIDGRERPGSMINTGRTAWLSTRVRSTSLNQCPLRLAHGT